MVRMQATGQPDYMTRQSAFRHQHLVLSGLSYSLKPPLCALMTSLKYIYEAFRAWHHLLLDNL
jgi:hypothetical protein